MFRLRPIPRNCRETSLSGINQYADLLKGMTGGDSLTSAEAEFLSTELASKKRKKGFWPDIAEAHEVRVKNNVPGFAIKRSLESLKCHWYTIKKRNTNKTPGIPSKGPQTYSKEEETFINKEMLSFPFFGKEKPWEILAKKHDLKRENKCPGFLNNVNESLKRLLTDWEVEEEYLENFKRQKIRDIFTLNLLTSNSLERLFPEEGPRLIFKKRLDDYRKEQEKSSENSEQAEKDNKNPKPREQGIAMGPIIIDESTPIIDVSTPIIDKSTPIIDESTPNIDESTPIIEVPVNKRTDLRIFEVTETANPSTLIKFLKNEAEVEGKLILANYKKANILRDIDRNKLADICVNEFLKNDLNKMLIVPEEEKIVNDILKTFPNEPRVLRLGNPTISRQFAAGRGKLFNRFYYVRKKLKTLNLISSSPKEVISFPEGTADSTGTDTQEINEALNWLQNNKAPWEKVLDLWTKTSFARYRYLLSKETEVHEYMELFPAFRDADGHILCNTDFEVLHPGAENKLFTEYNFLSEFITKSLTNLEKETIEDCSNSDAKRFRTLTYLNKLFPVVTAARKGKEQWRPSRIECREALIFYVKTAGDIQTELSKRKLKYKDFGLTLGVQAIVVGNDRESILESYVSINDVIYAIENPLKAEDIAFKAMIVFDTPYHVECRREWMFIQLAIYGIQTRHDKKSLDAKTSLLIEEYKKHRSS